ncbi:MAG TPA: hypothetical protein VI434_02160 [Candidatus Dormibacteraeota bacterium]
MDWDWHLTIELATLAVATIGTFVVLMERFERRRLRGLATQPAPRWRVVHTPSDGALAIEVSNHGGAAPSCCVIVQVGDGRYAGNFPLADRQDWGSQTLTQFDTIPDASAAPYSLVCAFSDALGYWTASGPNLFLEGMVAGAVPDAVSKLLLRTTGRRYVCAFAADGRLEVRSARTTAAAH